MPSTVINISEEVKIFNETTVTSAVLHIEPLAHEDPSLTTTLLNTPSTTANETASFGINLNNVDFTLEVSLHLDV